MAWRTPTLQDIAATLSQKELEAYRTSPDFASGADPVEDLLKRTAAMVRGYVRKNKQVRMSAASYDIPESLISPAMDYAAFDVLKRMPVEIKEPRKDARQQALDLFKAVANGEVTPESFDESEDESHLAGPEFGEPRKKLLNEKI